MRTTGACLIAAISGSLLLLLSGGLSLYADLELAPPAALFVRSVITLLPVAFIGILLCYRLSSRYWPLWLAIIILPLPFGIEIGFVPLVPELSLQLAILLPPVAGSTATLGFQSRKKHRPVPLANT